MKKVEAIATEPEWAGGWKEALDRSHLYTLKYE